MNSLQVKRLKVNEKSILINETKVAKCEASPGVSPAKNHIRYRSGSNITSEYSLSTLSIHVILSWTQIQGGERTSQSRDQNIEKGYTLRNFLSLRTGKINFFNTSVVPFRKIASAKCETNFKLVIIAY